MSRGRRWLGGLLCVVPATLLGACGETSQPPGGPSLDRAGNGAGGALNGGSSGSSGSGGSGGGGAQGQNDPNCPNPWPELGSPCIEGQRCFHPGSTNPCAPPDTTYTCSAGTWTVSYGSQIGNVCLVEACSGVNLSTGCPFFAPAPGTSCAQCSTPQTSCQFSALTAKCVAGLWQVTDSSHPSTGGVGGAGGTGGTGGTGDEAGGAGGAP